MIAFIFARGGSKGVLDKNIREVAGKPLIAHAIESSLESKFVDKVVVSTDSQKIAEVARKFGAEVLVRPDELATDTSYEILSWKHAIENFKEETKQGFLSLPATSPLRTSKDIDQAISKYMEGKWDVVLGISPAHRNPYLNMVKINSDGSIETVILSSKATRRQDVPDVYDVTTCVYVGNVEYIQNSERLMDGKVGYVLIPPQRSLDIDTEYDLYLANLLITNPYREN